MSPRAALLKMLTSSEEPLRFPEVVERGNGKGGQQVSGERGE